MGIYLCHQTRMVDLGLMAYEPRWFRSETVFDYLQSLADEGFFRRFRNVTFTGTSMGGYAACAFSRVSPGCRVVALSPQSTLDPELVPWEDRFAAGRKAEWSGRFRDAARQTRHAAQVWIIYDPEVENDARHAERFTGRNVRLLRARHAGHKTALFLRRAEILSKVMEEVASGVMTEARFYELYRRGRDLPLVSERGDRPRRRTRR